ncbi:MAG: hypothetical protein EBS65_10195 [Betaproteobacteria bacterium]|nr:hypothetical protein [Betaproteobacteria bacterium]
MHSNKLTRHSIAVLAFATLSAAPFAAQAQSYPTRPVTVIVPQAPGGANDTVARVVLAKLSEAMGQQFVVENRTGAGGNVGTQYAAKAAKDGYTLLLTVGSAHTINPALYKNAGFDPVRDFDPISVVGTAPYVLAVNANVPVKNVAELVAWIKAQPSTVNYASAGNGTLNHLLAEMFKQAAGVNLLHIPYKAAAASVTDVVNGTIPVTFASLPAASCVLAHDFLPSGGEGGTANGKTRSEGSSSSVVGSGWVSSATNSSTSLKSR